MRPRTLALGLLILAAAGLAAQTRRPRGPRRARAQAAEKQRWLQTAQADLRAGAFASAARAYEAALQLAPGDPAARAGLARAHAGACEEDGERAIAQGQWGAAAARLRRCPARSGAAGERDLATLHLLDQIEGSLARSDWPTAELAMRRLAAAGLPAALDTSLAPAYARFGAGDGAGAARLAAGAAGRPGSGLGARADRFNAFVRDRARRRAWRAGALPLLAAYLMALAGSLYAGLRGACGVDRRERSA